MRFHLDLREADHRHGGMSADDARDGRTATLRQSRIAAGTASHRGRLPVARRARAGSSLRARAHPPRSRLQRHGRAHVRPRARRECRDVRDHRSTAASRSGARRRCRSRCSSLRHREESDGTESTRGTLGSFSTPACANNAPRLRGPRGRLAYRSDHWTGRGGSPCNDRAGVLESLPAVRREARARPILLPRTKTGRHRVKMSSCSRRDTGSAYSPATARSRQDDGDRGGHVYDRRCCTAGIHRRAARAARRLGPDQSDRIGDRERAGRPRGT